MAEEKRKQPKRGPARDKGAPSREGKPPRDRRVERDALRQRRNMSLGLDFDCTITTKHFYKCFAWGYFSGNDGCHAHYEELKEWIEANAPGTPACLPPMLRPDPRYGIPEVNACCDFLAQGHKDAYVKMMREFFLGGEERIGQLTQFFDEATSAGVDIVILTAGVASGLMQLFADCVPEWIPFFPTNRIHDTTGGSRHRVATIEGLKMLIMRDITPKRPGFLVDDALARGDPPPEWMSKATEIEPLDILAYEGTGLQPAVLDQIRVKLGLAVAAPAEEPKPEGLTAEALAQLGEVEAAEPGSPTSD